MKDIKIEITSLEGAPSKIGFDMIIPKNLITSLEGAPSKIGYGEISLMDLKKVGDITDNFKNLPRPMSDYIAFVNDAIGCDIL